MAEDSKMDTVTSKKPDKKKEALDQQTKVLDQKDLQVPKNTTNQQTQIINKEEMKTMMLDPETGTKTTGATMTYDLDGITPDIPTIDDEEPLDTKEQSKVLKNLFPDKTKEEKLKINRNFLRVVEPFKLYRLVDEIKNFPENLKTGFTCLDHSIRIPQSAITLVASHSRIDKNLFLLNLIWNMVNQYPYKHFLYFTYEDIRREILT